MSSATLGALRVEKAGPLATLQDVGRFGSRRLGMTQGGAADLHAFAWTNHLIGNRWDAAALEVVLGGLTLVAEQDTRLALGGADLQARVDDRPLTPWQAFTLSKGEQLVFGSPTSGVRAYLAVPGGFQGEPVLGSLSCVVREGLGGHDGQGRALAENERLTFSLTEQSRAEKTRAVPVDQRLDYRQPAILPLIPGAQIADFTGGSLFRAFNHAWQVDTRADRMGVRLTGPALRCRHQRMISEGIALGAVQVPPDGQPIVLLNDRQTIGGYPRLGTLTPLACARLAQCQPGEKVYFAATALTQAQEAYRLFRQAFS
ncbi:biotin-dependent carboxyltransferase [Pistricoccus aurantiacus]|uniref:Biotin-dependent carboxyltransferase n=1 Tax=Pistricoccus aurantiacus TaxID=1883414 RepID=A0A5B8SR76_9GAMM|nr:biotin-dependent carboxyltransferase family protein [Pistricoccus aurantiacus]QEA37935.1 biotin-dependent carboxyltransferase [Pistricoccus aurantiacus]